MASKPRLAIVGASVRAAARSAVRAGFDVVAADLFADADLNALCPATRLDSYPEGLCDWLVEQRVDAWMYTGALENQMALIERMASVWPLWGVSGQPLRNARDPQVLQRLLADAGVPFPETQPMPAKPIDPGRWLAKSYAGGSGSGVSWLYAAEDWRTAHESQVLCGPSYAQRFVSGQSMSVIYAVSTHGATLLGMTEQLVGEGERAPEWSYCGSIGPIAPSRAVAQTLDRLGTVLVDGLRLRGLVGVDFIVREDEATVIEINPRFTASAEVLERAAGRSVVGAHRAACCGDSIDAWPLSAACTQAKRILYARREIRVSDPFVEWAQCENAAGRLADLPRRGDAFAVGGPVCTLIASGANAGEARKALLVATLNAERILYSNESTPG